MQGNDRRGQGGRGGQNPGARAPPLEDQASPQSADTRGAIPFPRPRGPGGAGLPQVPEEAASLLPDSHPGGGREGEEKKWGAVSPTSAGQSGGPLLAPPSSPPGAQCGQPLHTLGPRGPRGWARLLPTGFAGEGGARPPLHRPLPRGIAQRGRWAPGHRKPQPDLVPLRPGARGPGGRWKALAPPASAPHSHGVCSEGEAGLPEGHPPSQTPKP
ncbi:collagen alpha-1(III) chain-like [Perognathus longimembris pacificus]|uniref:collagen alpha-1(III) chain-like n=1 Tax=Perognathus longimembris pacificus TaxID=214514 RepID=UPI0020195F77|nr:collagen alpha-1(III) chain-like [Perognathus longimembris pacificus]